jgi:hypothetical protein
MNRFDITNDNNLPKGVALHVVFFLFFPSHCRNIVDNYSSAVQDVVLDLPLADGNLITLDILQRIIVWIFFKAA